MINPFDPNNPAIPSMFAGREIEGKVISKAFLQARANRASAIMLLGERGIGKTSLLNYTKEQARGNILVEEQTLNFLVCHVTISETTTRLQLIKKINFALQRELAKSEEAKDALLKIWKFLGRFQILGNSVNTGEIIDNDLIFDEFCASLSDTIKRITSKEIDPLLKTDYDGLLIIIDECDTANEQLHIGSFSKLLLESLQKEGSTQFILNLTGLHKTKLNVERSHPSAVRIFEEIHLERFTDEEAKDIITKVLDYSKEINGKETKIEDEAMDLLVEYSDGFPHFIHQFGYCAFELCDGDEISASNVLEGAFGENGAIKRIGNRFYSNEIYKQCKTDSCLLILKAMGENIDSHATFAELLNKTKLSEDDLMKSLIILNETGIISEDPDIKDSFALNDKAFAWWLIMDEKKQAQSLNVESALKRISESDFFGQHKTEN